MKDLQKIFGIKWERPLRWYEWVLLTYTGFSALILGVDVDRTPFHLVVFGLLNFCASIWICGKVLPKMEDEEDEIEE